MKSILNVLTVAIIFFSACKKSDPAPTEPVKTVPTITTGAVTNITSNSATGSGILVSHGNANLTQCGVAWGLDPNPFEQGGFRVGVGWMYPGPFTCTLTPLLPHTKYYAQAYAANTNGFGLGEVITFTTP